MNRAACLIAAALVAGLAMAANGPPLASVWNIAASGSAESSGDLAFRITPGDGSDPVDITVPVISGASQDSVARSIQRALSSQLRRDLYRVQLGENGNVLVSDPRGQPNFSLDLVDSDIENVRVAVRSVTPAAPPTVPAQAVPATGQPSSPPANTPVPATPPGEAPPATAPGQTPQPANTPPAAPPPSNSPALPNPSPPPSNTPAMPNPSPPPDNSGTSAPASAPPPR